MPTNSVTIADSVAEQYASVMDGLITDCSRLEDRVAELENSLQAAVQDRDAVAAERDTAQRERDQALQSLEDIEGTFGDEELYEYCEVCDRFWHRDYVTWFAHPFETEDGNDVEVFPPSPRCEEI